jgi:glycosyltransferase involved in cell wall biosynthesis
MDYRVRVLNISDFVARKNLDGLLRVWLRATRADDDAILILKVGKGGASLVGEVRRLVEQGMRATGRRLDEVAPIALLTDRFDEQGIAALYAMATHYFSLSHGEGWDLPITRAGCLGAGLIAPRHSAYTAYLNDGVAHLIPCTTGPARMPYCEAYYPPFHGLDWWHPDEDAAADILSRVIRDPEGERRDATRHLRESFTWDAAAHRLLDALDGVGS